MMAPRFRRYTVPDLEAMRTVETLMPAVFRGEVVQQVKQVAPPFRYSLLRSTGRLAIPTRVLYEERTGDEWNVIAERQELSPVRCAFRHDEVETVIPVREVDVPAGFGEATCDVELGKVI